MNPSDAPEMQSYPSPNAIAADSAGPFYASSSTHPQPGMPNPDELQLTARITRTLAPTMNTSASETMQEEQGQPNQGIISHQYEQAHQAHQTHPGPLQSPTMQMDDMGGQYGTPDGSGGQRKRSKVSRACDECRRKKIRCDADGEPGHENCSNCRRVGSRCQFSRVPMKRGPSKGYIKELADRLGNLEGAIQAGQAGEIPPQFFAHQSPLQRRASDDFSPPPPPSANSMAQKRPYSSVSSGEFHSPYQQRQQSSWTTQEPQRHLSQLPLAISSPQSTPIPSNVFREPNYSPNGLPPLTQWRNAPEPVRRQSASFDIAQSDRAQPEHVVELDGAVVKCYYNMIHPTYPILSQTEDNLNSRLRNCSRTLRDAFHEALHTAIQSSSPRRPSQIEQRGTERAMQLITASQVKKIADRPSNLVHLQTLLLMAIEADNSGPAGTTPNGTPSAVWLGNAVGLAYSMKLHKHEAVADKNPENDQDSDGKLARRIWWSLVIMDRFHAASTSSPVLIPDSSVVVYPEDQALLGDGTYHLARLSIVLGHFSAVTIIPSDLPEMTVKPVSSTLGMLLRGELERVRESFPTTFVSPFGVPLVHLSYWYLRIHMELALPEAEPSHLLIPAKKIVTLVLEASNFVSPLTHHALALAVLTLIELKHYAESREEADDTLKTLLEGPNAVSRWDVAIRGAILKERHHDSTSGSSISSRVAGSQQALVASQGLQRLADLATADAATEEGFTDLTGTKFQHFHKLRSLISDGYLSVFGG